jgi:hypothetical protein
MEAIIEEPLAKLDLVSSRNLHKGSIMYYKTDFSFARNRNFSVTSVFFEKKEIQDKIHFFITVYKVM